MIFKKILKMLDALRIWEKVYLFGNLKAGSDF